LLLRKLDDTCLLAVLRCCADDPRSLFSAARAHGRLHQAAVLAASSMRVEGCTTTKKRRTLESVLCYLTNHQQHVSSLEFGSGTISGLYTLPRDTLQGLSRLSFSGVNLKLQPLWTGRRGVGPPLKQLCIHMCTLQDSSQGKAVAAALKRLPSLEHLSFVMPTSSYVRFHSDGLKGLKQLTYLELAGVKAWGDTDIMRHVQVRVELSNNFCSGFCPYECQLCVV
jgi:hypothetical protein